MKRYSFILVLFLPFLGFSQQVSDFIVVDQFGYRPNAQKIAKIRDPQIGFDATLSFSPGNTYVLVNATNNQQVFSGALSIWNAGATDSISGDKVWWFDFSSIVNPGTYYVLDIQNNVRSAIFDIKVDVYNVALKHALRCFYYQRAGHAKVLPFAETGWVDQASHVGTLQDKNCRIFSSPNDMATEKNLYGGWYDAGDYNKYTSWTGNYIIELLKAYEENPTAWTDDYNIPESGNGIPDILDEVKWGMDFMLRLQNSDGSLISIVSLDHASPPSAAKGKSVYGNVNTSSTLKGAATYAYGAKIFKQLGLSCYADSLKTAAQKAWTWADANPAVVWENNKASNNSVGVGAGNVEVDDYARVMYKLEAAVHLFDLTSESKYQTYFDNNYTQSHLMMWTYAYPFEHAHQETLLYYTSLKNASAGVVIDIKSKFKSGMNGKDSFFPFDAKSDPYMAYLKSYTWGSNAIKCNQGLMFYELNKYNINLTRNDDALKAAENFIHYMHGNNPLNKVFLSNMNQYGAENSVQELYHTWFAEGSKDWDKVGVSTYGPAPGFIVGGVNPKYKVDACCATSCGSTENTALCSSIDLSKVLNQPPLKSYMDFNNSWPINSWEITENSGGSQVAYIRLVSKFIQNNGVVMSKNINCNPTSITQNLIQTKFSIYPNPSNKTFTVSGSNDFNLTIYDMSGKELISLKVNKTIVFGEDLPVGEYLVKIENHEGVKTEKIIKK